jgi:hypothetical protein
MFECNQTVTGPAEVGRGKTDENTIESFAMLDLLLGENDT